MTITSSRIVSKDQQIDGRYNVREEHADDQGNTYSFDYMCAADFDCEARLAARIGEINAMVAEQPQEDGEKA